MKKVILLTIWFAFCATPQVKGQAAAVNKASGPEANKENVNIRYYYFPNIQAYFDLKNTQYIYQDKGQWVTAEELPHGYMGYSLNNKISVPITDYEEDNVTQLLDVHKKRFPPIRGKRIPAEYKQ